MITRDVTVIIDGPSSSSTARYSKVANFQFQLRLSQQNEHKSASQRLELAHPPKEPIYAKKAICAPGSPGQQAAVEASLLFAPLAKSDELEPALIRSSLPETVKRDGQGRIGTIRIILESVNRRGRSSASLPDGTVIVRSSRQAFLDAARVLVAAGHDPDSWLEGWRPGATAFALRARLGIAAGLTVDETRTV